MKQYIQPALRAERVTTAQSILNLSFKPQPADESECYTEEEKAPATNIWGEEW